jgi:hypothetical protein
MSARGISHRARRILEAVGRAYPGAWKEIDHFRRIKGNDLEDWPDWCFMPIAAGIAIVSGGETKRIPTELGHHPGIVTGLATWRYTQGIYRFDPDVYRAIVDTSLEGGLPTELLFRLPEWCVYVEVDSTSISGRTVHGFWAWLEHDVARGGSRELRLLLDMALDPDDPLTHLTAEHLSPLLSVPLSLDAPNIEAAWSAVISSGLKEAEALGEVMPIDSSELLASNLAGMGEVVRSAISLLLYLCSQTSEITNRARPDRQPGNPAPKRTRRHGLRVYPADGPAEWDVGVRMGAALRAAYQRESGGGGAEGAGRHVRPHVRRAHWHTFLSGPRKRVDGSDIPASERRRELRWMPPIAVNLDDLGQLPATIKPVK